MITEADITRAVQISASVQVLSANGLTSLRDQVWLSFMNEFYERNPNSPASLLTAAYTHYTNEFNNLVASAGTIGTLPSQAQLLNLIAQAGSQVPAISNNVTYAIAAVQQAAQAAQMASLTVQNAAAATSQATAELTSAMQLAANQFVAVPVQTRWNQLETKALSLAESNPQFRNAYQNVIAPITQIAPGDTLDQMLENVPSLQNNLALSKLLDNLDENGVLQNPIGTIATSFNNQMNQVSSAINNTLGSIQGIIQQETPNLPDYLQITWLSDPGNLNIDLQQSTGQILQSASTSFNMLSDLMGPIDANLSQQIGTIGQFATTLGSTVNSFAGDAEALTGAIADFSSGDMLGAISGVFSMFGGGGLFGGGGPSPTEQELLQQNQQILQGEQEILAGEGTILTNMALMQQDMDTQFSNVDQSLNTIYTGMQTGFSDINSNLNVAFSAQSNQIVGVFNSLSYQLQGINSALVQQQIGMSTFEQNVYSYAVANENDIFSLDVNTFLGYQATYGHPMPSSVFSGVGGAQPTFLTWATTYAQDAIQSPGNCGNPTSLGQTFSDVNATNNGDPSACLNCINSFVTGYLNVPSIAGTAPAIPNPHVWAMSANAYIQLMRENPALFQSAPGLTNNVQSIIASGDVVQSAVANITYTRGSGVNWPLWKSSFQYYRVQVGGLANALSASQAAYISAISVTNASLAASASNTDLIHEHEYAQYIAGNPSVRGNIDGTGTGASFEAFGGLCPTTNGGVRGLGFDGDTYRIRRIDPDGSVVTEITIPPSPYLDGQFTYMGTMSGGFDNSFGSVNGPLLITSFFATPDGTCYITLGNDSGNPDSIDQVPYLYTSGQIVCRVNADGSLTTVAGQYDEPPGIITSGFTGGILIGARDDQFYVYGSYNGDPFQTLADGNVSNIDKLNPIGFDFFPASTSYNNFPYDSSFSGQSLAYSGDEIFIPGFTNFFRFNTASGTLFNVQLGNPSGVAIASTTDGTLWIKHGGSLSTFVESTSNVVNTVWSRQGDQSIVNGTLNVADLGSLDNSSMCVDSYNNLYLMAGDGNELVRIGTPWFLQQGLFDRWSEDLSTEGTVNDLPLANGSSVWTGLDTAKGLIADLATFGLSGSLSQDDVMHSLLNGPNGLIDSATATALVNSQVTALAVAPVHPVLDLPTLASNRLDALWCQIASHLLDVQSRASLPTDGLVFDVLITNGQAQDISPAANPVALLQTPQFTNSGVADQSSLICNGNGVISVANQSDLAFSTNTDFTVGFWAWMPSQGDVYVGSAPEGAQAGASWSVDFNNSWSLTSQLQPDSGTNIVLASFSATNFLGNQSSGWFYITVVATRAGGVVQYYVDGSKVGQNMIADGTGGFGAGNLFIGGDNSSSPALVNEVSVWRRALGPSEISRIYNAAIAGMNVPAYSGTVQRSSSPTEPLALIDTTLQNLQILQSFHNSAPPVPVVLSGPVSGGTGLQLQVVGEPGMNYVLQSSSDFKNWQTYQSNILESSTVQIPVDGASKVKFFRATQQPIQ